MEFLRIEPTDISRWQKVWDLYEDAFPIAERRKINDHIRANTDRHFSPLSVWEGNSLLGIVFYWEWESYKYVEHMAVARELRGLGYGSLILRNLRDSDHTIILEIDPLINEQSVRRLQFYERAGFTLTPYRFVHLPYRKEAKPQELLILSYPEMITKEQHNNFLNFLENNVIQYCEGQSL